MTRKFRVYAAFTLIIAAMAFLLISGFDQETMTYYTTVNELKTNDTDALQRGYRVAGLVVTGTVEKTADQLCTRFVISEAGATLPVVYDGILPDTFREGAEVLLEGRYTPEGVFHATYIMTKCASKYDPATGEMREIPVTSTGC